MKRIIISLLAILLTSSAMYGQKQGTIVYEQTLNLHKSLGPDQQALKAMIPETTTQKLKFTFNERYGCLKDLPTDSPKGMMIKMGNGNSKTWFNFEKDVFRQYIDLEEELFHTETPMSPMEATPTGKTKTIINYLCQEYKSKDGEFCFWVAENLPTKLSPMPSFFFDGAILAIDSDKVTFKAISFSKDINEQDLVSVESQEITKEQFEDLQEEKMSEMKAMGGKVMKVGN